MTEMTTIIPLILLAITVTCAVIFDFIFPDATPGGIVIASGVGGIGAWMGSGGLWHLGPDVAGVPVLPAALCSIIMLFMFAVVFNGHVPVRD